MAFAAMSSKPDRPAVEPRRNKGGFLAGRCRGFCSPAVPCRPAPPRFLYFAHPPCGGLLRVPPSPRVRSRGHAPQPKPLRELAGRRRGTFFQHPCAAAARPAVCRVQGAGRVLTRSLGPSSIPSLGDGVMLGTAWIDRPVDTQGCAPCFHVLLSAAWKRGHAQANDRHSSRVFAMPPRGFARTTRNG